MKIIYILAFLIVNGCGNTSNIKHFEKAIHKCKEKYQIHKKLEKPVNYDRIHIDEFYDGSLDIAFIYGDPGLFEDCHDDYQQKYVCLFDQKLNLLFMIDQDSNPLVEDRDTRKDIRKFDATTYWLNDLSDLKIIDQFEFRGDRKWKCEKMN